MMKTGGYHAAPRQHGSRLAGPHPCLPPKGEGEKARGGRRGSQRGRESPLPPLFPPPVGEGAKAGGRTNRWRSINRSLVQPFFQHQIHNPLLSLIRSHAMVFLEKVCYPDHCLGPFFIALAPGVGGDALPRIAIKKRGIHKMVQGSHPCTASISFSKQANPPQQQVTQNRQGNNGTHQ